MRRRNQASIALNTLCATSFPIRFAGGAAPSFRCRPFSLLDLRGGATILSLLPLGRFLFDLDLLKRRGRKDKNRARAEDFDN